MATHFRMRVDHWRLLNSFEVGMGQYITTYHPYSKMHGLISFSLLCAPWYPFFTSTHTHRLPDRKHQGSGRLICKIMIYIYILCVSINTRGVSLPRLFQVEQSSNKWRNHSVLEARSLQKSIAHDPLCHDCSAGKPMDSASETETL